MTITGASTVFQVADLDAALPFNCQVLSFTEDFRFGQYAGVHRDVCCLHLCVHSNWKRPCGGGAISAITDEVDRFHDEVKARGANIQLAPADQPYGMRDFLMTYLDGNLLTFNCPLQRAE